MTKEQAKDCFWEATMLWGSETARKLAWSEFNIALRKLDEPKTYTAEQIRKAWAASKHTQGFDIADLVGALERPEE